MAKRGPKPRGEKSITFDDYKTFAFLKSNIITAILAEIKQVDERTALVEKWYQAWKESQCTK